LLYVLLPSCRVFGYEDMVILPMGPPFSTKVDNATEDKDERNDDSLLLPSVQDLHGGRVPSV
jgi:hypothetical protein